MSVLFCGCGWLGQHFARQVNQFPVSGTTRSKDKAEALQALGVTPYLFQLGDAPYDLVSQINADVVVLNIPPGRKGPIARDFASNMIALAETLLTTDIKRLIFISTTSVFGNQSGTLDETSSTSPITESGHAHAHIEQQLLSGNADRVTVLRLSGLVGPDRHPAKYLAGRQLDKGEEVVNLVHVDDVIRVLIKLIETPSSHPLPAILHACSTEHPRRDEYYTWCAKQMGLTLPVFEGATQAAGKQIVSTASWRALGLTPEYASPYDML